MTRMSREGVEQKLAQARRLALEPNDPLTEERLAQMIEELEFQLQDQPRSNILGGRFARVAGNLTRS
jgi:cytochrome c-type biogenesis protein CcmH/NrfG